MLLFLISIVTAESAKCRPHKDYVTMVQMKDSDEFFNTNPARGYLIYSTSASQQAWDLASACYYLSSWKEVAPTTPNGPYRWDKLEAFIAKCASKGKQTAFGFYSAASSQPGMMVPSWLPGLGCKMTNQTVPNQSQYPVWSDPVYIEQSTLFTKALAAKFDGRREIAFIDARNYGNWGEWHVGGGMKGSVPADQVTLKKLVDAWGVFKSTHIVIPNNNNSPTNPDPHVAYGVTTYGLGCRRDSSDVQALGAAYCIGKSPSVSEWSADYPALKTVGSWAKTKWTNQTQDEYMKGSRYTYDNLGQFQTTAIDEYINENRDKIIYWGKRLGYWFKLVWAVVPQSLGNGNSASLEFRVKNDGVAPLMIKGTKPCVKAALMGRGNEVLATTKLNGIDPSLWQPGTELSQKAPIQFPANPNAAKIALGVFSSCDDQSPDIKLSNTGRLTNNWIPLE